MLKYAKRVDCVLDRDEIIKIICDNGFPIYDKIIEFQVNYGGMDYIKGDGEGFCLGILMDNMLNEVFKINGKFYFECGYYCCSNPVYVVMDENGKIFMLENRKLYILSESIEALLEEHAKNFTPKILERWVEIALSDTEQGAKRIFENWKKRNWNKFKDIPSEDIRIVKEYQDKDRAVEVYKYLVRKDDYRT